MSGQRYFVICSSLLLVNEYAVELMSVFPVRAIFLLALSRTAIAPATSEKLSFAGSKTLINRRQNCFSSMLVSALLPLEPVKAQSFAFASCAEVLISETSYL